MNTLAVARLVSLASACAASVAILKMSAQLIRVWPTHVFPLATYAKLLFVTSTLSTLSVFVMLVMDISRKGRIFTSWIVVEVIWLNTLWMLWFASAKSSLAFNPFTGLYDWGFLNIDKPLPDRKTLEAVSFLAGGILMAYALTLSGLALIGRVRGNCGWTSTVRDAAFLSHPPIDDIGGHHITQQGAKVARDKGARQL